MKITRILAFLALLLAFACTQENLTPVSDDANTIELRSGCNNYPVSAQGVDPGEYVGNFVASDDDQVCYELSALGYIGEVTGEMRGFKIDPPVNYSDGYVSTTISADGRYLDWESMNATVLAFVIKGGPNYHVYGYVGTDYDDDQCLASPLNKKKIPAISHYNVCYTVPPGDGEGCTPGYWRNHTDRWFGVSPSDNFDATFGVTQFGSATLCQVISAPQTYGTYAFHAIAALLNAYGGVPNADGEIVDYAYNVQQVIDGYANGTLTLADFTAANEAGCPLSGTRAVKC